MLQEVTVLLASLEARVRDAGGDEFDGADGVVIARNDEVDQIGVAVGVGECHDRDVKLPCLVDRDVLVVRIDDEENGRKAVHLLDAAKVLLELLTFATNRERILLAERVDRAVLDLSLDRTKAIDSALHCAEVGERATEPTTGDEELTGALRFLANDLGGLALGSDEKYVTAAAD